MKNSSLFLILVISMFSFSCSKQEGKTTAKLKLNLSGIVNISSGIGSGGAILFGKKDNGDMFGKKINSPEENLDIPNGAWTFYALMWDTAGSAPVMNGKVHCGKTAILLNGTAATIAMSLNNANCTDPEFSGGKTYVASTLVRFADIFIEECDEIDANTPFSCGWKNQGSALSYRFVFNSFKKNAAGAMILDGESLVSDCKMIDTVAAAPNIYFSGLPVNFPSGNGVSPFIGSIEFFMGNVNCTPDVKGVHKFTLHQGVGAATSAQHHVLVSDKTCTPNTPDLTSGDAIVRKNKCDMYFGTWNGSTCSGTFLPIVERFAHAGVCSGTQNNANSAIKHQFILPKPTLCGPYLNNSSVIGSHPFAGGAGSMIRPYKICNEWQMNQIGEMGAPDYSSTHFKLMNDLDMNKADFGPYAKPTCANQTGSILGQHHNLNSLIKFTNGACNSVFSPTQYQGTFEGNNKTIRNGRIQAETVDYVGFARKMGGSGVIRNLNFENLEVDGNSYVGGIAGYTNLTAEISNISLKKGEIHSDASYVGAATGFLQSSSKLDLFRVHGTELRGRDILGGLVGKNQGIISRSMFNGHIDQQHSLAASAVGGLVGDQTATGTITTSFSEGSILTSAQFNGGIAGINAGTITHAYSTMFISSSYFNSNSAVGGIVGDNTNSGILNVYSDSILEYTGGGATPAKDGVVATGTMPSNTTACFSSSPTTTSGCSSGIAKLYNELRDGTNLALPEWKSDVIGSIPRLAWEFDLNTRPCLLSENLTSVASQVASGRGTSANPVLICTSSQMKQMNGASADKNFRLVENLNISDWFVSDFMPTFSGVFDGGGNALYGLNVNSASNFSHGLIRNNSGTVKNLKLSGNKMVYTGSDISAILAGTNSGIIHNVEMRGNYVDGVDMVGSIAAVNTGTIDQVHVEKGLIRGQSYVGGVVGYNSAGTLSRAVSKVDLRDLATYQSYSKFGGVTGANYGTINQTVFDGRMEFLNQHSSGAETSVHIGGIAGYNNSLVKNSIVENYVHIKTKNYNAVGGLIGTNDFSGVVNTSLSLGSLVYDMGGVAIPGGKTFHQLIGTNSGTFDPSNTFFLEKRAGALIASVTASSCNGTDVYFTGTPADLTIGNTNTDMLVNRMIGGNGNNIVTFFTYSPPATNYVVASNVTCNTNDYFDLMKSYQPDASGILNIGGFADINNFSDFDIAYIDPGTPANSTRQDDLYEYYLASMENRAPTRPVPVWELEVGDSKPRLVQLDY